MRAILIASLAIWSLNASAFDGSQAVKSYDAARPGCRQAELNGKPISAEESDKQCELLAHLGKELKDNGYCWVATEQEWAVCK